VSLILSYRVGLYPSSIFRCDRPGGITFSLLRAPTK
jgi:hypothetical protein